VPPVAGPASQSVLLPARLVALLREDAVAAVFEAAERLRVVAAETPRETVDRQAANAELWHLDAARKLLEKVGVAQGPVATALTLTQDDHPVLVSRLFRSRLQYEIHRHDEIPEGARTRHRARIREIEEFLARLLVAIGPPVAATRSEETRLASGHHPELAPRQWPR
jgi:hypothetical protein